MGKQLAITENGKYIIGKKLFITDENLVHRKVKKAFLTVDGVHQLVYSSSTKWAKHSCYTVEVPTSYTQVSSSGNWSIGDTQTTIYYRLPYATGYYFSSSDGFVRTGYNVAESWEEVPSDFYMVGDEIVWKKISCRQITDDIGTPPAFAEVTWECVGLCEATTKTEYVQGSTSYGTIEAEDGELPEEGTLIDGSIEEGYCVLDVEGNYYYYEVKAE